MVTSIHITHILEKIASIDFVYENDTIVHDSLELIDYPDNYPAQERLSSWDLFLPGQQHGNQNSHQKQDRKFPIRIFTIQPEA